MADTCARCARCGLLFREDESRHELQLLMPVHQFHVICLSRLKEVARAAEAALPILTRYREKTPLGHQPHMIAHEADDAISRLRADLAGEEPRDA